MEMHDDEIRKKSDAAILAKAHDLTNGNAENPKITGEVLYWLTEEQIEQGRLLRLLVQGQKQYRLQSECILAHSGAMGKFSLFCLPLKVPVSVFIVMYFIYKMAVHYDPVIHQIAGSAQ